MSRITRHRLAYWRVSRTPLADWPGWGRYRVHVWLPVAIALLTLIMILFGR